MQLNPITIVTNWEEMKPNNQKVYPSFWHSSLQHHFTKALPSPQSRFWGFLPTNSNHPNVVDTELLKSKIHFYLLLLALWTFYYFKHLRQVGWQLLFTAKANHTTDLHWLNPAKISWDQNWSANLKIHK